MNKKLEHDAVVLVIGDIHEQEKQFNLLVEKFNPGPKRYLVSVGDIYDKGEGMEIGHSITRKLMQLEQNGFCFVVRGNHEAKHIKKQIYKNTSYSEEYELCEELNWWSNQPFYWNFEIGNFSLLVMHGGISPNMKDWKDLNENIMYVRDFNPITGKRIKWDWKTIDGELKFVPTTNGGISWHEVYDGRFGYAASGHNAQHDGKAKFYPNSCNLDSACYATGILTGGVFGSDGLQEKIEIQFPRK
jgi:predicted phosphodiesterase